MPKNRKKLRSSLEEIASQHLGIESLRPGQEAGLNTVLKGRDTLVVMPTDAGKSAIARKHQALLEHVQAAARPGIVYVATRKHAEELAELFQGAGLKSVHYHAGLTRGVRKAVEQVSAALSEQGEPLPAEDLLSQVELSKSKVKTVLAHLADLGAVDTLPTGEIIAGEELDASQAQAAADLQEQQQETRRSRLDMMRSYAETTTCRRAFILGYFGEPFDPPCGACGNCRAGAEAPAAAPQPFPINSQVEHGLWGTGTVLRYEGATMTVLFETVGYKTLDAQVVSDEGLLTTAGGLKPG